jgi:methyl-accepting chemotaxis protein
MVVGLSVNDYYATARIDAAEKVVEREQTILNGIEDAQSSFLKMGIGLRDLALARSPGDMDAAYSAIDAASAQGQQALKTPINIAVIPKVLQDISDNLAKFSTASRMVGDYIKSVNFSDLSKLQSVRDSSTIPIRESLQQAVDSSLKNANHFTEEAKKALSETKNFTDTVTLIIELAIFFILVGTAFMLRSSVVNPVRKLTDGMLRLSKGDTAALNVERDSDDEIGQMYKAVEIFRQNAIQKAALEVDGERARAQAEHERAAMQQRAEEDAAQRLAEATAGLASGLRRLAGGDLSFKLTEAFSAEFEPLRHDFNTSVDQLSATLSIIANGIQTMDNGTREIASGTNDLSKRTEQQAASLEETAAAVEEITSNVANSTKRTEEARNVASRANESAIRSADVVAHAEEAMRKIEESSQQISNIIGVIDEIAFQTNLLALNAGVEAARAGEAGKGFAVVAQEVRELAQRAAHAAKEIKGLIQNSSSQVENGVKLVRGTGDALKTIGGFIIEMNAHMESIATSAREQSTGLMEVNQAVNSMDQSTQQNAAMVEEATAASEGLAQEASRLRDLIAQFTLAGPNLQASSLRQTAKPMAAPVGQGRRQGRQTPMQMAAAGGASWEEF